jgi:replication initiation protein RepC
MAQRYSPTSALPTASRALSTADPWWAVFRDLRDCQSRFGLKPRHLDTLAALLSFLKGQSGHMMVFASNASIQERMNGKSIRSLQRNLNELIEAGLLRRRASPNGKRFAKRGPCPESAAVYGLDLAGFLQAAPEIERLAEEARAEARTLDLLKLRLRELRALLLERGAEQEAVRLAAVLRRKLETADLQHEIAEAKAQLPCPADPVASSVAVEVIGATAELAPSDSHSVMHHQMSEKEDKDRSDCARTRNVELKDTGDLLRRVKGACGDAMSFCGDAPRSWEDLRSHALQLAAWIGIDRQSMMQGIARLGADGAAITIFAILQAGSSILKPAAYFRSLVNGKNAASYDPLRLLTRLESRTTFALPSPGC